MLPSCFFFFFCEIDGKKFHVFFLKSVSTLMIEKYALDKDIMKRRLRPPRKRNPLVEYILFTYDKANFS